MKPRHSQPLIFILALIMSTSLSCSVLPGGGAQGSQPTGFTPPTQSPPTGTPQNQVPFELDSRQYMHPSGAFSFFPPAGWSQDASENGSVTLLSPDQIASIYVTVSNTGYELTGQGFLNFAQSVEENFFRDRDQYRSLDSQTDPASDLIFKKTFMVNDVLQQVVSIYHQEGIAIYNVDYQAESSQANPYMQAFQQIKFQYDPSKVTSLPVYNFTYKFKGPKNLFEIEVPLSWKQETSTDVNLIVDSIHAPDEHASIESIVYDDGYPYAKADAGQATLRLLNEFYTNGAGDISITEDSIMEDRRERLTWESKQGGFSGITTFEVRNETSLIIFSVLYDNPYEDTYRGVLEYVIDTYEIPQD
jgi:hypothetical protein